MEHKTDAPAAEDGQLVIPQRKNIVAIDQYLAVCRAVKPAEHVQQRGLARTGGTDHRDKLAAFHRKIDAGQRVYGGIARAVYLAQRLCL